MRRASEVSAGGPPREPSAPAGVSSKEAQGLGAGGGLLDPSPAAGTDDAGLAAAAASGDARAFEEIVRRHAGLVLGLARRILGSRDAAEDLLQDVFVKVHRSLPSYRGEAGLKGWIARITVNAARNRRRDDGRRLRVVAPLRGAPGADGEPAPELADLAEDGAPSPEREALSSHARGRIEAALQELPDEFREAPVLREIEGLSYDEIATALGVSMGTVKSRIARARLRLQEALGDLVGGGWP